MRYLSRDDIEKIAERVWVGYKKLPGNRSTQYFIRSDPEKIIKELLRLKIDFKSLSKNHDILGLTSFSEMGVEIYNYGNPILYELDGKTVLIDQSMEKLSRLSSDIYMIFQKNFTIMHEGAHQILKMIFPKDYGVDSVPIHCYRPFRNRTPNEWEEWQADALATALLMPSEVLEFNLMQFGFTGWGKTISLYRSQCWESDIKPLVDVSYMMGVSRWAMGCRMKYLGFIKGFDATLN